MRKTLILIFLLALLLACRQENKGYSFFVAGHTYGSPNATNAGLHPPFLEEFSRLNDDMNIELGILTGDIVRISDTASWDAVDAQLANLRMPVYFSPGNHDTYNRPLYEERYGNPYFSFFHRNDLFIILDGNISRWNIDGDQLAFLEENLQKTGQGIDNVFVFVHQLIWWNEDNIFAQLKLNWPPYTPDTTNYWSDVEPMLQASPAPVCIFAGDLGANSQASPVMCHHDKNITYIASGMGSIKADNYIIVNKSANRKVSFELIALGGERDRLGRLEDYRLPAEQ